MLNVKILNIGWSWLYIVLILGKGLVGKVQWQFWRRIVFDGKLDKQRRGGIFWRFGSEGKEGRGRRFKDFVEMKEKQGMLIFFFFLSIDIVYKENCTVEGRIDRKECF